MKLRIRDNSLLLRLGRSEVEALHRDGVVAAAITFPGGRPLRYAIESSPAVVNPAAFLSECQITVRLPENQVLAWATSEQVSIRGEQRLDDGETLEIRVEKDVACPARADDADAADRDPRSAGAER